MGERAIGGQTSFRYIEILPNPFDEQLRIDLQGYGNVEIVINNLSGQKIANYWEVENSLSINTSQWTSGIYFIQISSEGAIIKQEKLIKQNQ